MTEPAGRAAPDWDRPAWTAEGRRPTLGELLPIDADQLDLHGEQLLDALAAALDGVRLNGLTLRPARVDLGDIGVGLLPIRLELRGTKNPYAGGEG